ncbi:MAG: Leucine-tRNA ligase [Candidatus Woesebacteria bacterium GW2011_GWA2_40_7b]|uniref:leucine--tRNA ligase n=1 Tax=Candidatus Woesebacteria bacterium GW2011_GWA2_40_7b TaxID=1618563 RepID=A0A0G0T2V2_9BACT|nr:MAG: Leucine-tRNA ligase [Candidatus Woesebacteria bacterium GW2011_GWA2_40_7b]
MAMTKVNVNMAVKYDHTTVEKKWQDRWEAEKLYVADIATADNPFFNLWMFPYPSAEGLHAGHAFASTGSDIYGRFMRMNKKDVFQPIGYDSFGIHSENYAIKINEKPGEVVNRTTKNYEKQMRSLGHGYDWTRTVTTSEVDYYRWTQWLFIKMFEAGLAYRKKATVNFCPSCKTVLADEQVIDGKCERCSTVVGKKDLDQWFFKITDYAERLLTGLDKIDWSERVITAQRNWIGKSEGMIINFKTEEGRDLPVFTTRPDTLNAVTFMVVADEKLYNEENPEKIGEFTGQYALNPLNSQKLPIWKTNYVAPEYGTGNIMGVPVHDERDREFAEKYHLDIVEKDPDETLWQKIEKEGWGKKHTNYHLRDWLVSRQRYWGAPIPMIDCPKCRWVAVAEKDLPVLLPNISDYKPEGTGRGPLANHKEFYTVRCPRCGSEARRETDVMDTFVDSSWYFLAYPNVGTKEWKNVPSASSGQAFFDEKIMKAWLPVNLYFGGAEHSVLHLMYARFVTMVLYDLKFLDFDEPFPRFYAHGLMIKDGAKMSKSRGNVINPDEYIKKFGADALRIYLAFMGPMDASPDFRDSGIEGASRFLGRVWRLFHQSPITKHQSPDEAVVSKLHSVIKGVTEDIEQFKYNTALAKIMELVNFLTNNQSLITNNELGVLAKLLAPFAPHMMEEIWVEALGMPFSIHKAPWPVYEAKYTVENEATIIIQIDGKLRSQLTITNLQFTKEEVVEIAKKDTKITKYLDGCKIKNIIFVSGKLLNFVTE